MSPMLSSRGAANVLRPGPGPGPGPSSVRHGRLLLAGLLSAALAGNALAAEAKADRKKKKEADGAPAPAPKAGGSFHHWGKLGVPVPGTEGFVVLSYTHLDDKGKKVSEKTMVQVSENADLLADQQIRLEDLKESESVYIFGKRVERDVPSRRTGGAGGLGGNSRGKDYQIQAARVILAGENLDVNLRFEDPKDKSVKWHKAVVTRSTAGLSVRCENNEHRVTLETGAPVLRRVKCDQKLFRSGRYVLVTGSTTDVPAEAEKKATTPTTAVRPRSLVILDPRHLSSAYPAILP